jgi:hypothetical protein
MRLMERWIIKLAIFHLILLLLFQFIFQRFHYVKDMQRITFYEGVNKINETPIVETWKKYK